MATHELEIVLVPYDVLSPETPAARGPVELIRRGFARRLGGDREKVEQREVGARPHDELTTSLAGLALGTARRVARAYGRGNLPIVLSGSCLTAVGVAHGLQRMGRLLSTLWIDAHGDFHTPETSVSGYLDGMALAALCGRSLADVYSRIEYLPLSAQRLVHLGGRSFEETEQEDFDRLNVLCVEPSDLEEEAFERVWERLAVEGNRDLYLHLDIDAFDVKDSPDASVEGVSRHRLAGWLERLPPPAAITVAGVSFEGLSESECERQVDLCVRLVEAAIADPSAER